MLIQQYESLIGTCISILRSLLPGDRPFPGTISEESPMTSSE